MIIEIRGRKKKQENQGGEPTSKRGGADLPWITSRDMACTRSEGTRGRVEDANGGSRDAGCPGKRKGLAVATSGR